MSCSEVFTLFLAIETSGRAGSVALLSPDFHCFVEPLPESAGSAKTLAPAIDRLLRNANVLPKDLTAIFLLTGPGSFTGLRVGVATAKAMAYALNIPVTEIDSLDAIAFQNRALGKRIHVVMDAYRGQVFYAPFDFSDSLDDLESSFEAQIQAAGQLSKCKLAPTTIVNIEHLLETLRQSETKEIFFCGPGCDRIQKHLSALDPQSLPALGNLHLHWLDGPSGLPKAESVAALGFAAWLNGIRLDPFTVMPHYYRASAAEEKRDAIVK